MGKIVLVEVTTNEHCPHCGQPFVEGDAAERIVAASDLEIKVFRVHVDCLAGIERLGGVLYALSFLW
jgi:hypothetical protein